MKVNNNFLILLLGITASWCHAEGMVSFTNEHAGFKPDATKHLRLRAMKDCQHVILKPKNDFYKKANEGAFLLSLSAVTPQKNSRGLMEDSIETLGLVGEPRSDKGELLHIYFDQGKNNTAYYRIVAVWYDDAGSSHLSMDSLFEVVEPNAKDCLSEKELDFYGGAHLKWERQ